METSVTVNSRTEEVGITVEGEGFYLYAYSTNIGYYSVVRAANSSIDPSFYFPIHWMVY